MEIFSIGYALLAVQVALLDVIAPELRAVVVDFCKRSELLYIRFYYDGEASEKLIDLWECAITEASAALGPDCLLEAGVERLDYPKDIPLRGRYAYLRMEHSPPLAQSFSEISVHAFREIIDFKEKTALFISPVTGEKVPTNWGIAHHGNGWCHTVPAKPGDYKIDIFPVAYAQLAMQRALLGRVTPQLRGVIVDAPQEEKLLYIRFFYDGQVDEKIRDLWECAITECSADFGPDYVLDAEVQRLDFPRKIPFRGRYVHWRKE